MIKEIKNICEYKKNGKYKKTTVEMAKRLNLSRQAIGNSRKDGDKLDKLVVFEEIQELIESIEDSYIAGSKKWILNILNSYLDDKKNYEIYFKETRDEKN